MYLENGAFIDAVRIEGSQEYRDLMRSSDIQHPMVINYPDSPNKTCPYQVSKDGHQYLLPASVFDRWNEALKDMLVVLRDSVKDYVYEWNPSVIIAFPFPISGRFYDSVSTISSSVSIDYL